MAQDDKNFLSYCVKREDLLSQLRHRDNAFVIINAPRGSGKSGLLIAHEHELHRKDKANRVVKKFYSDVLLPTGDFTVNQYINFWKNTILGWVISTLGAETGFAASDDATFAVEFAEKTGEKQKNLLASVLSRLQFSALPIKKLDFDPKINEAQIQRILDQSGKLFWILLDEMDDHYTNSYSNNNLLLGLLQASKSLSTSYQRIKLRVTIRPHIMTILRTNHDIVQKFRQHELPIAWEPNRLRDILVRRITHFEGGDVRSQLAFELTGDRPRKREEIECEIVGRYIQDFDMKFAEGRRSQYRALFTLSFGRPRWMIEFIELALQMSETNYASVSCCQKAMHEYGNNRIQFIVGEHRFQHPELESIINHLSGKRKLRFGTHGNLRAWIITHIIDDLLIDLKGAPKEQVALRIADSLYMVEFLRAKERIGGKDNHRFYTFTERPDLLKSWRPGDKVEWEIHPTFARGLNLDDNNTFRVGSEIRLLGEKMEKIFGSRGEGDV